MLKWLLRLIALLVLAGLGLFLWGRTLPEHHVAPVSARYARPPAEIWELVADPKRLPEWYPDISKVTRLPDRDGKPCWLEETGDGPLTVVHSEVRPPQRLVTELVFGTDEKPDFSGRWIFELVPDGAGTRLTLVEDGRIHNPLFRALAHAVFGYQSTSEAWLKALGRHFGEDVVPERGEVVLDG